MLAPYFVDIRFLHIGCVVLSGAVFGIRGLLRVAARPAANHRLLRFASHVIDIVLLGTAVLLTLILHEYPLTHAWLTAKVLLLVLYIGLGTITLKRARTTLGRSIAFLAAILTFISIIGVAVTHQPAGWLTLMQK